MPKLIVKQKRPYWIEEYSEVHVPGDLDTNEQIDYAIEANACGQSEILGYLLVARISHLEYHDGTEVLKEQPKWFQMGDQHKCYVTVY